MANYIANGIVICGGVSYKSGATIKDPEKANNFANLVRAGIISLKTTDTSKTDSADTSKTATETTTNTAADTSKTTDSKATDSSTTKS